MFSYEFCENFKDIFFYRTPPAAASIGCRWWSTNHEIMKSFYNIFWIQGWRKQRLLLPWYWVSFWSISIVKVPRQAYYFDLWLFFVNVSQSLHKEIAWHSSAVSRIRFISLRSLWQREGYFKQNWICSFYYVQYVFQVSVL